MTHDEIIEMARQALKQEPREDWNSTAWVFADETLEAFAKLVAEKALAQPEQEPVAWQGVHDQTDLYYRKPPQADARPLYTTPSAPPPQRTWVGLTDDDKVLINHDANFNQFMTAGEYADIVQQLTEARLKDLNT